MNHQRSQVNNGNRTRQHNNTMANRGQRSRHDETHMNRRQNNALRNVIIIFAVGGVVFFVAKKAMKKFIKSTPYGFFM